LPPTEAAPALTASRQQFTQAGLLLIGLKRKSIKTGGCFNISRPLLKAPELDCWVIYSLVVFHELQQLQDLVSFAAVNVLTHGGKNYLIPDANQLPYMWQGPG
jgi:hypothetical protein